jgi:cytidine deaminase
VTKSDSRADDELVRAAWAAGERAHSPYSGVRVGAALRARDGRVFAGCNVENASYGLTLCAERTALVKAVSEGARAFEALAVTVNRPAPAMPCGACRQALAEFAEDLVVLVESSAGTRARTSLAALLPERFGPSNLAGGAPRGRAEP